MKKYLAASALLIFVLGLSAALILTQGRQEIRKKAAVPGGGGRIILSPSTTTRYLGETFSTAINFQTGTGMDNASAISSISLRITYPYSGKTPELDVIDNEGNPSNQIYPDSSLVASGEWMFPIKSVTRSGKIVTIDLAAINTSINGYTSSSLTPLATIYFKANQVPATNPITLSFDLFESKMLTKADPPEDILEYPLDGIYTIQDDTQPPTEITDLTVTERAMQSLNLSWSAPADNDPGGKANTYDLRYSTATITDSNWSTATQATGLPAPETPGIVQTFTVSGLGAGIEYYFALKSSDTAGNISDLSNIASGNTLPATLSFGFKLQGVNVGGLNKLMTVTLRGQQHPERTYVNVPFISNDDGVFTTTPSLSLENFSFPSASVSADVLVKDANHLRKNLGSLTLAPIDNLAPSGWNSLSLKAGDFNDDNLLNIADIGNLLAIYTALSISVIPANQAYDIDMNNTININDVALVLANYIALEVHGDE